MYQFEGCRFVKNLMMELSEDGDAGYIRIIGLDGLSRVHIVGNSTELFGGPYVTVYDDKENPVTKLGVNENGGLVGVSDKGGEYRASLGVDEHGGSVNVWHKDGKLKGFLSVDNDGGLVSVRSNDGKSTSALGLGKHGGYLLVSGNDGAVKVWLRVTEHGGYVEVTGKAEGRAVMGMNEYGNGAVSTWDKNGYRQ